jgi:ABC-type transport system substrate-binding protein
VATALTLVPAVFHPAYQGTGRETQLINWGIYEPLFKAKYASPPAFGEPSGDGIAQSWEVASDGSKVTMKIRTGVKFHRNYGELDANDVVYTFSQALRADSRNYRRAGMDIWMDRWEVVDARTAVMYLKKGVALPGDWWTQLADNGGGSVGMVSKKLFDTLGETRGLTVEAGTGPYTATSWLSGDEVRAQAVPDHWRGTPKLQELVVVDIPEVSTRQAALESGQIDIADIPVKFAVPLAEKIKGKVQELGVARGQLMWFSGNYWAKTWTAKPEEKIYPRPGFKPDKDHPWIGDPFQPDCDWDDLMKNPKPLKTVCPSMEKARKVRWAMAMAIDKDLINKQIEHGLGRTYDAFTAIEPKDPWWKEEWKVPFDPVKAKQLLAEAGYPSGFSLTVWVAVGEVANEPEVGLAIADMWRSNLGLNVTVERTAYAARRPTLVARTIDIPFQHSTARPFGDDFSLAVGLSQAPSTGWNAGIESEFLQDIYYKMLKEPDRDKRIQMRVQAQDYYTFWRLDAPSVYNVFTWVVGPKVAEWAPHQTIYSDFTAPDRVVMK